jgi:dTDP-4-amino-4,6-dideoxygalactose transaminase
MLPVIAARKLARRMVKGHLAFHDPDDESLPPDATVYSWRMAGMSRTLIANVSPEAIVSRRRSNYEYLLARLLDSHALEPIHRTLPPGVCPLYFPVLAAQPERTVQHLAEQGIGAIRWWGSFHSAVEWSKFPHESFLKRHLVALPVHQDLTHAHMRRLIDAIHSLKP